MSLKTSQKSVSELYHENAEPEKESAKRLADSLEPWRNIVPPGPLLEIGAGTGLFTDHLIRMFPKRNLTVSDSSDEFLSFSKKRIGNNDSLTFSSLNAETDDVLEQHYSLICGNHVAHLFNNAATALEKLALGLKVDGLMLMSFLGEDSFKEWRTTCLDLGIPYTGKDMPGTEALVIHLSTGPVQVDFYEDQSTWYFDDFKEFLSHKSRGDMNSEGEGRHLTDNEISLLNKNWKTTRDGKIGLTYHNVFLAIKRIGE